MSCKSALSGGVCAREVPYPKKGNCVFLLLLDPAGRFDALVESARAWRLAGSRDAAVEALTNALAAAEEFDAPGEGLAAIHAELEELEQD